MFIIGKYNVIEDTNKYYLVTIGNFNHIHNNVSIGENTTIGDYCEIEENVKIGKNCVLQGRIRIGSNAMIADNCIIKYGAVITDYATIGNNTFIGPNVITLGAEVDREKKVGAIIGRDCFIGAGAKIAPNIKICDDVIIGANSFVKRSISNPDTYVGNPARALGYI